MFYRIARVAVVALAPCWISAAQAQIFGDAFNGDQLETYLGSDDDARRTAALAYVAGVVDLHLVMVTTHAVPPLFCRPSGVNRKDLGNVVERYIEKHPESRQVFAADVVTRALGEAYPCAR